MKKLNLNLFTVLALCFIGLLTNSAFAQSAYIILTGDFGIGSDVTTASGIGDVNNDGYDDYALGSFSYDSDRGKVVVLSGEPPLETTPMAIIEGDSAGDCFGFDIAPAGDVNSDGYDDFLIGAPQTENPWAHFDKGKAYLCLGSPTFSLSLDYTFNGTYDECLGHSLTGIGDFDNDSYDDFALGGPMKFFYWDYTFYWPGNVHVFCGDSPFNTERDLYISATLSPWYLGYSLSALGDVNNDGFDDFMTGAYRYSGPIEEAPHVRIYLGGNPMDNDEDLCIRTPDGINSNFGRASAGLGSINGDSYDDIIVGSPNTPTPDEDKGRCYVYYGGNPMDSTVDMGFEGVNNGDLFGYDIVGQIDFNMDGQNDLAISAPGYDSGRGKIYIVLSPAYSGVIALTGTSIGDSLGIFLENAGDLNGDGFNEILVGTKSTSRSAAGVWLLAPTPIPVGISDDFVTYKPDMISLFAFPNPFNSACHISAPENAELDIFDINGRSITEFDGGDQIWTPEASVGSGIYLVRAKIGDKDITKRVVYLK